MSTDIRQDIESILMWIYGRYYYFSEETLYYKMKGKDMEDIKLSYSRDFTRIFNIILDQDLDWELYINYIKGDLKPTEDCIVSHVYSSAVSQFIEGFYLLDRTELLFKRLIYDKDPLTQLLMHGRVLLKRFPQRSYFCFYVGLINPDLRHPEDPTSIFHGKRGVVAYCTTFANFVHLYYEVGLKKVSLKLGRLHWDAVDKLGEHWGLCDIEHIKNLIHDEIEKANELMRQYGIIRVAFPLE